MLVHNPSTAVEMTIELAVQHSQSITGTTSTARTKKKTSVHATRPNLQLTPPKRAMEKHYLKWDISKAQATQAHLANTRNV